jgi:phosphoglycolate phosphatase-like HAD superfamily hydrolase
LSFLNTIVEFEGPVVNVKPRYWAAHREAIGVLKLTGPTESEWWRLLRLNSPDGALAAHAKGEKLAEYSKTLTERRDASDLMLLDEAQAGAAQNLRVLKGLGSCHLVTLCSNRDGINATLDRLQLWMHFDQKRVLPEHRERRVAAIQEVMGGQRTLAVVGTVPMAYAAGEAGCRTVGIRNGPTFPKLLQQVGVDVFFDDLDQLTDAITKRDEALQRIGVI